LTSATLKKAALRLHPARWVCGFLDPARLRGNDRLECLLPDGQTETIKRGELQAVYFVSDFAQLAELTSPPRRGVIPLPGLRVRVRTRGGSWLEGILATELLHVHEGVDLTPPHTDSPWQHVFVPSAALLQLLPVEVVRTPRRRRPTTPDLGQFPLFHSGSPKPDQEVG
jgi:hypothetical protein